MTSARQPDESRRGAEQQAASPQEAGDEDVSSAALRQIVEETVSSLARPADADPALLSAMQEVARRFAGEPIAVDPVGAALMEAVLRVQFPVLAARPALLSRTARSVATTLLADPAARLRVEHLWATLAEGAA